MVVTRSSGGGSAAGRGVARGRGGRSTGRGAGRGAGRGVVADEEVHVQEAVVEEQHAPAWARQMQTTIASLVAKVANLEESRGQTVAATGIPLVSTPLSAPIHDSGVSRVGVVQVPPPPVSPAMQLAMQETWMRMAERFQKMNPPNFDGSADPMVADKWVDDMKVLLRFLQTDQIQSRKLAAICLKGDANKWWQKAHTEEEDNTLTWDEFVQRFENQYIAEVVRANKEDELNNIKQGELSITEYENKFISLLHFAKDLKLTPAAEAIRFEKGLNDDFCLIVKAQRKGTVKEVADASRAIEGDISVAKKKKEEIAKVTGKRNFTDIIKEKQGAQPRRQNDRWDPEVKRQRMESRACFRCGEQGHKIADCIVSRGKGDGANSRSDGVYRGQLNALGVDVEELHSAIQASTAATTAALATLNSTTTPAQVTPIQVNALASTRRGYPGLPDHARQN